MSPFIKFGSAPFAVFAVLLFSGFIWTSNHAQAQIAGGDWEVLSIERVEHADDVICTIPHTDEVATTQVVAHVPARSPYLHQQEQAFTSQFDIDYAFSGRQEIREGVEMAAEKWSQLIRSPIPITVRIELEELADRTLAVARMAPRFLISFRDGQDQEREFIFPPPLASYLSGQDLTPDEVHFTIAIHPDQNWYFGTGTPPEGHFDFISVMMHEFAHGLGIFGSMNVEDGRGIWPGGEDDVGLPPYIYDGFSVDEEGSLLTDTAIYPNPSTQLGDALKGDQGGVYFSGTQTDRALPEGPAKLYSPEEFNFGNSYSHLDISEYPPGDMNSLMKPRFAQREVIRTPGSLVCGMLADMGWGMGPDCFDLLGGFILAFDGTSVSEGIDVHWSVKENAPVHEFVVESLYRDAPVEAREFKPLATVDADDALAQTNGRLDYGVLLKDLRPGRHLLRLRARDADGNDVEVSPEQQITMPLADQEDYHISGVYPNPALEEARVDVTVTERQDVTMEVIDTSGRRVLVQRRALIPNIPSTFFWDAGALSSGTYFVRLRGDTFSATEQFAVIR